MNEERLKELENFAYSMTYKKSGDTIIELIAKVRRLREALKFYADDDIYTDEYGYGRSLARRAREALE